MPVHVARSVTSHTRENESQDPLRISGQPNYSFVRGHGNSGHCLVPGKKRGDIISLQIHFGWNSGSKTSAGLIVSVRPVPFAEENLRHTAHGSGNGIRHAAHSTSTLISTKLFSRFIVSRCKAAASICTTDNIAQLPASVNRTTTTSTYYAPLIVYSDPRSRQCHYTST